jgi:hypothetical protein
MREALSTAVGGVPEQDADEDEARADGGRSRQ